MMEENKLIKLENGALQKVGNAMAITNKLIQDNFDYLNWWNNLSKEWKEVLIVNLTSMSLSLNFSMIRRKRGIGKHLEELNQIELIIAQFNEIHPPDDLNLALVEIKYLISTKEISIYKKWIDDFEPLKLFYNLETLIIRGEINCRKPFPKLQKLKKIDFSKADIDKKVIEAFQKDHPNCEIIR